MKRNKYQILILQKPKKRDTLGQDITSNSDGSYSYSLSNRMVMKREARADINPLVIDEDTENKDQKLSLPDSWSPEYGIKIFHDDYGIGIIRNIYKANLKLK